MKITKGFRRLFLIFAMFTLIFSSLCLPALADNPLANLKKLTKTPTRGNSTGNIVNIGFAYAYSDRNDYMDGLNHQFVNIYDGYVYYVDQSKGGRLYRKNLSTCKTEKLSNTKDTAYVNVINDTIFFVDVPAGYRVTRMDLNGKNRRQLTKLRASRLCAYGGCLYFANWDGNNTGLWKMDYDGSCRTQLTSGDVPLYINVNADGIYWISNNEKCICRTTFEGRTSYYTNMKKMSCLNMYGDYAYFVWNGPCGYGIYRSSDLCSASLVYAAGKNEKTIDCLNVCSGRIYYRVSSQKKSNKTDGKLKSFTY